MVTAVLTAAGTLFHVMCLVWTYGHQAPEVLAPDPAHFKCLSKKL